MEFNLTVGHIAAVVLIAYVASAFLRGDQLLRFVGWSLLWQLLTPVRPWYQDLPLLVVGFFVLERLYRRWRRG